MDFLAYMYGLSKKRVNSIVVHNSGMRSRPVRSFADALRGKGMRVIAEIKYASPVDGDLDLEASPVELARDYERLGASAISCLTEEAYFKGKPSFISEIGQVTNLPILMKDFIVDSSQILLGFNMGADAYLLITEMLSMEELRLLYHFGRSLGLDALVEIHSMEGLRKAMKLSARIIGINARDLSTLKVVTTKHEEMIKHVPRGVIKVAESGVNSADRLLELEDMGYDAALVGRAMSDTQKRKEILSCGSRYAG